MSLLKGFFIMARVKNTMQLIEASIGKINGQYDMCAENVEDIRNASHDFYDLICNGFRFGYIQGMKAAKAEMNRDRYKEGK